MVDNSEAFKDDFVLVEQLPLQILLVEDTVVNQKLALLVLKKIGYPAKIAVKGSELLTALKLGSYDVILIDIRSLETYGFQIAQHVGQELQPSKLPYIIAMNTINSRQIDHIHRLEISINDYINKPIQAQELVKALGKYKTSISSSSAIDFTALEYLRSMLGGDEVAFIEVISCYLTESPHLLQTIKISIINQDAYSIWQTAHKLKSSSASLGAKTLTKICLKLEAKGQSGDLEGSDEIVVQLEQEYNDVKTVLERIQN